MLSKNKIKFLHSLEMKKNRDAQQSFVAEGPKIVHDILSRHKDQLSVIAATEEWFAQEYQLMDGLQYERIVVSADELTKVSFLCHPQQVFAVFRKFAEMTPEELPSLADKLTLVLDGVQDPGNLGTIIRIADWFGIEDIVCSMDTVDVYNPKVVQATMGSIARVRVEYRELESFFDSLPATVPVYGTLLEGENIYKVPHSANGIIVMGNEGKGISQPIRKRISKALRIPNYPENRETADSLNVAVATAIICSEFRRPFN